MGEARRRRLQGQPIARVAGKPRVAYEISIPKDADEFMMALAGAMNRDKAGPREFIQEYVIPAGIIALRNEFARQASEERLIKLPSELDSAKKLFDPRGRR